MRRVCEKMCQKNMNCLTHKTDLYYTNYNHQKRKVLIFMGFTRSHAIKNSSYRFCKFFNRLASDILKSNLQHNTYKYIKHIHKCVYQQTNMSKDKSVFPHIQTLSLSLSLSLLYTYYISPVCFVSRYVQEFPVKIY